MNTKILTSLAILAVTATAVAGGTMALFHDSRTVAGNKIVAGKFALSLDSQCHYDGLVCGENNLWTEESLGSSTYPELINQPCTCTWSKTSDLAGKMFFNLDDVKPGDNGESTISFHVDNNPAWICADFTNIKNYENCCTAAETSAPAPGDSTGIDNTCDTSVCADNAPASGEGLGELQKYLKFNVWMDNGAGDHACNNIKDGDETYTATNVSAADGIWPIVDSSVANAKPILDGCVGIEWSIDKNVGNIIQTDSLMGDITFTAYQSRNNLNFTCGGGPKDATLTLNKIVVGTEPAASWTLKAVGPVTLSAAGTVSGTVPAGTYALSETGSVADYTNGTEWQCEGGTLVGSNLTLADGDDVTCEITNTYHDPGSKKGTIVVKKTATKDGQPDNATVFNFTTGGTGYDSFALKGGEQNSRSLDAGTYSVDESLPSGWVRDSVVCKNQDNATETNTAIGLQENETVTCVFTNSFTTQPTKGTLTVNKTVINDNGGTKMADDFSFTIKAGGTVYSFPQHALNGTKDFSLDLGTAFTVLESTVSGYTVSYTGTCQGTITANGAVCNIKNDDKPGTLTVIKHFNGIHPNRTYGDFSFKVNGGNSIAFENDGQNDMTVSAGTYNVVENYRQYYSAGYNNCSNVVVPNGGSATCTITNSYRTCNPQIGITEDCD